MILVGCDDGRVIMLHKSDKNDIITKAGLDGIVKRETIRSKRQPQRASGKSSVCVIVTPN
jgi:hypothetical protein